MTLTGANHPADRFGRLDTQMSVVPTPPARSDPNHSVSPSAEIAELVSKVLVFSTSIGSGAPNGLADGGAAGEPDVALAGPIRGEVDLQQIGGQRRVVGAGEGEERQLGDDLWRLEVIGAWRVVSQVVRLTRAGRGSQRPDRDERRERPARGRSGRPYGQHRGDASIGKGCVRNASVSLVVGVLLWSAVASAAAQANTARLDVDAAPGCSTRDELIARVVARSTRIRFVNDATGVPALTARIEAGPRGGVVAELIVVEPDGRRFARRLEAPSCAAATDALALVVAITLDPSAATGEAAAAPARPGRRGARPTRPMRRGRARRRPAPRHRRRHRSRRCRGRRRATRQTGKATRPRRRCRPPARLTAGVAAAAVVGPAPTPMPGIAVEAQAALDRASILSPALVLTLSHVWSGGQMETGGIAAFTLDLLALDVCPVRVVALALEARACAAGSVGRLAAEGSQTYEPGSVASPFATVGGTVRLAVVFGSRVELRARFGAGATLWRDAFRFNREVFHQVASVTLVGDVGIGVRFP